MQKTETIIGLAGYRRADLSVCLGCKICASVCTVNDLDVATNPQALLAALFLGEEVGSDHPLVRYCTGCYRCTGACPWRIAIPEVVRALRESLGVASPFEQAFKGSVALWGRVYEPYVFLRAVPFLVKGGYLRHMTKWVEYMTVHLPHKVQRRRGPATPHGEAALDAGSPEAGDRGREKR
jgi:ferredoxin